MIEDTTNSQPLVWDTAEKKHFKKTAVVTSVLALAAWGALIVRGRTLQSTQSDQATSRVMIAEDTTKAVVGPNSLFGDVAVDPKLNEPLSSELATNELDFSRDVEQAGLASISTAGLDQLDTAALKRIDDVPGSDPSQISNVSNLSAVPEPMTSGLLLLIAVPAVSLRRPRHRMPVGQSI